MITELNLLILPISTGNHFYLFLFIRNEKKKILLMQLDSLYSENRTEKMSSFKEWFLSNDIVKNEELELELFYSNEYKLQKDFISCACYVCSFAFYAGKLSDKIVTEIQWKVKFIDLLEADHDIIEIGLDSINFVY